MDELLEQRIKEYRLAVAFAKEFMAELGREKTLDVIGRAFQKIQAESAAELVEKLGSNNVEALAGYYRRRAAEVDNLKVSRLLTTELRSTSAVVELGKRFSAWAPRKSANSTARVIMRSSERSIH